MTRSRLALATIPLLLAARCLAFGETAPPERRPNIVIVLTDDQGYADVGCFGAENLETPNLDRLAAEGLRFTDFYVAQAVCSASRAALLTGCYPNRLGIAGALGPGSTVGLHADEVTLAELLRDRGYDTAAFGKWHLGWQPPFLPLRHGFDEFSGIPYSNDMWPWHPSVAHLPDLDAKRKQGYPDLPLYEGDAIAVAEVTPEHQARFTRAFTDRAVAFIERERDRPFLLYLAHPMPHVPIFASEAFAGTSSAGRYGDVIREIDWSVGALMAALDRRGVADETLFIFTSDNGPWISYGNHAGSAGPLREAKGTSFEGGVRVPCIMRWPAVIAPGRVTAIPAMTIDVLPTIAEAIGAELPAHPIDGRSILPILRGDAGAASPQAAYFFWYRGNDLESMRMGRWKLHFPHGYRTMQGREPGRDGTPGRYDYGVRTGLELYDLEQDVGETTDVAAQHPDVLARMQALADAARAELGDDLTGATGSARREPGRVE